MKRGFNLYKVAQYMLLFSMVLCCWDGKYITSLYLFGVYMYVVFLSRINER